MYFSILPFYVNLQCFYVINRTLYLSLTSAGQAAKYLWLCVTHGTLTWSLQVHRSFFFLCILVYKVISLTVWHWTTAYTIPHHRIGWARKNTHCPQFQKKKTLKIKQNEPLGNDVWKKNTQSRLHDLSSLLVNLYKALAGANRRWQISECHMSPALLPVQLWEQLRGKRLRTDGRNTKRGRRSKINLLTTKNTQEESVVTCALHLCFSLTELPRANRRLYRISSAVCSLPRQTTRF